MAVNTAALTGDFDNLLLIRGAFPANFPRITRQRARFGSFGIVEGARFV